MEKVRCIAASFLAAGFVMASSAKGVVTLFQDDFEAQTIGDTVGPPQIGTWSEGPTSGVHGADIVGSPALGTKSVRIERQATAQGPANGDLRGVTLPGAILNGNTVEFKIASNLESANRFNNPLQIAIGQVGSNFNNDFTFLQIGDVNNGVYGYYTGPGQFGTLNNTALTPSLNTPGSNEGKWDTLRAVLHIATLNATQMTGTMDLFISLNGAAEVQVANGALLQTTTNPGINDASMQIRIVKGPSTGIDFYDNVSVTAAFVPEPSTLSLAGAAGLLALRRRTKR